MSAIFYQSFIFHQMIALQKLWKMFFISPKKLFSFSRYSNFCILFFPSFSFNIFKGPSLMQIKKKLLERRVPSNSKKMVNTPLFWFGNTLWQRRTEGITFRKSRVGYVENNPFWQPENCGWFLHLPKVVFKN